MKRTFAVLLIFIVIVPAVLADNGSLLVLKNTYFYELPSKKGKRILTRKREAYDVIAVNNNGGSQMFKVRVPEKANIVNEGGYVAETDPEIRALGPEKIKVFSEIPTIKSDLTRYKLVPSNYLSITGRKEHSKDFPYLTWRAVNYKTNAPSEYWIAAWAGIYRPDKDADWLNRIYQKTIAQNLSQSLISKIMQGLVEAGYTKEEVRLALGEPVKEQIAQENNQLEWIYTDRKVIFKNNKVMQVL